MEGFKKLPKMQHFKTGGSVKRMNEGGSSGSQASTPSAWHVYDSRTGERANSTDYKNLKTASRAVDRLDEAYGSSRYTVKAAEAPKPLGPVNMTGSMGNTGGEAQTGNYRNTRSGGGSSMGGGSMIDAQIKEQLGGRNPTFKRGGKVKRK